MRKIIIIGSYNSIIYENAISNAFRNQGFETIDLNWNDFKITTRFSLINSILKLYYKLVDRLLIGPFIIKTNKFILDTINKLNPELVFINRGTHVLPQTILRIRAQNIIVISYNNDDPFGNSMPKFYWRHFVESVKSCNINFVYRPKNVLDYLELGLEAPYILPPYYIRDRNYPIYLNEFVYDVVFIGHYEDDGRDSLLVDLINRGYKVGLYGDLGTWRNSIHFNNFRRLGVDIRRAEDNYNLLLNSSKIALNFLSKKNNDVYTRRCFEIPATKTMQLSEYTKELSEFFIENREIVFFYDLNDALSKIDFYINDNYQREMIAENGYNRLIKDGHEVNDRVKEIIKILELLNIGA
jgi:spore maturation protein CgeB